MGLVANEDFAGLGGFVGGDLVKVDAGDVACYVECCRGTVLQGLLVYEAACDVKELYGDIGLLGVLEREGAGCRNGENQEV